MCSLRDWGHSRRAWLLPKTLHADRLARNARGEGSHGRGEHVKRMSFPVCLLGAAAREQPATCRGKTTITLASGGEAAVVPRRTDPPALGAYRQPSKRHALFRDQSQSSQFQPALSRHSPPVYQDCCKDAYCSLYTLHIAIELSTARQCQMAESARRPIVSAEGALDATAVECTRALLTNAPQFTSSPA